MALTLVRSVLPLAFLATFTLTLACSEDSDGSPKSDLEAGAGTGGASGSGGASTAGSGGATGAGGYDPALALECGADAGSDDCRVCLAATCCDDYAKCMRDTDCAASFEEYQRCFHDPATPDATECFPSFVRDLQGGEHVELPLCVVDGIGVCQVCGPPAPF